MDVKFYNLLCLSERLAEASKTYGDNPTNTNLDAYNTALTQYTEYKQHVEK